MPSATLISADQVKQIALECGFELAGIAPADPNADYARYRVWLHRDFAGEMKYLTDHRADLRTDPRQLLPSARSILCVGKLYNTPQPYSTAFTDAERGWISRYAWGDDYHDVMREGLDRVSSRLESIAGSRFESRICVDTAPLLERSYARLAGLGWIGRNTCLISQTHGSWFFLGELLTNLEFEPDFPAPDRCGTCRRCIDACPTEALVPSADGSWTLNARLCISYLTIEKRGFIRPDLHSGIGRHIFGCDICQDVCPWNRKEHFSSDERFLPQNMAPPLARLAELDEDSFRALFRNTPVWRSKYRGMLRNVAVAMGNSARPEFVESLERLAANPDPSVADAAKQSLERLGAKTS